VADIKKPDSDDKNDPEPGKALSGVLPDKAKASPDTPEEIRPTTKPPRRGGFIPALIGGVLAAFLGFVVARTEVLDPILPAALNGNNVAGALLELQTEDSRLDSELAALKAELEGTDQPDLAPLNAQIATLLSDMATLKASAEAQSARIQAVETRLDPLNARLAELEKRPMTEGASDTAMIGNWQGCAIRLPRSGQMSKR